MDDIQIVELYFKRCESAIDETAKKYGEFCFSIAYNILHSRADSEESVNDTYLGAWNSIPPHRPSVLSSFLAKLTRRISIDKWRKTKAEKRGGGEMTLVLHELENCISDTSTPEKEFEYKELAKAITLFVKELPAVEQKLFVCRYWYLDSIEDIAKRFAFSKGNVRTILYRTRNKLRDYLKKEGF
ncbi:MAG: sigma-70 family RNA polymerase sigma factor [Clostridia bacterium]|nr:sigma-70 family RNA polymerase sigma factor [Clostridia bacterium]